MRYRCPVCGFTGMPFLPEDNNICSCCGTEFGYDDLRSSHADLRREWVRRGMPWFSTRLGPPIGWSPNDQLNALSLRWADASVSTSVNQNEAAWEGPRHTQSSNWRVANHGIPMLEGSQQGQLTSQTPPLVPKTLLKVDQGQKTAA
jgi:hypothetical protein